MRENPSTLWTAPFLTPERYIEDAHTLVLLLRQRFDQEKVYVLGESWGSALGIMLVQRYPELFHAFIGTGQMVAFLENDQLCYDFALDWAQARGDTAKIAKLSQQGPPPYYGKDVAWNEAAFLMDTFTYMNQNPAIADNGANTFRDLAAPEYGLYDKLNWFRGVIDTLGVVYPQLWEVDFRQQATHLEVPVYFFIGRYDINAPTILTEQYFELLDAPHKEIVWFEHSGHTPWVSESGLFVQRMADTVVAQTTAPSTPDPATSSLEWVQFERQIHLSVDPSLAQSVKVASIPAVLPDPSILFAETHPASVQYNFLGYLDGMPFELPYPISEPRLSVYAVQDFPAYGDDQPTGFLQSHARLQSLLADRPELTSLCAALRVGEPLLPFLPWLNSSQVFCSHPQYLQFEGGEGVRYLTAYAQGPGSPLEHAIFYTFQGMSEDGGLYITAVFPVRTGIFPTEPDPNFDMSTWQQTLQSQLEQLHAADEAGFNPPLSGLDTLVKSLTITMP